MSNYLVLHYGFEPPTPEIMAKWNEWFDSIADRQVQRGHLPKGAEISASGVTPLPFRSDSITGFTIITAESFEEAQAIVSECPFVESTRVYEVMG